MGTSMATTQADILLEKYFRRRIIIVKILILSGTGVGFIIFPIMMSYLLVKNGYFITLLLQTSMTVYLIFGAALFHPPKYEQANSSLTSYSLLENEDDSHEVIFDIRDRPVMNQEMDNVPAGDINLMTVTDVIPAPKSTDRYNPELVNPQPLFCDSQVAVDGQDMAFYTGDGGDDEVTVYTYGDHIKDGNKCYQNFKTVIQPMFYSLLLCLVESKITTLALWLFLPIFGSTKVTNISFLQASAILSLAGIGDMLFGFIYSWTLKVVTQRKYLVLPAICFATSVSLFALVGSFTVFSISCSAIFSRFCTCAFSNVTEMVVKQSFSTSGYNNVKPLLSTLSGLGILLAAIFMSSNFESLFRGLAWCHLLTSLFLSVHLVLKITTSCFRQNGPT